MTAPATLVLAKMLIPETGTPETAGTVKIEVEKPGVNVIDAAATGARDGLFLALNIGGMLIAFLALIALVNGLFGLIQGLPGMSWMPNSLQQLLGWIFSPAAWMMGAVVSFTAMAVAGRELQHGMDTFELMLYRSAVGFAIVTIRQPGATSWSTSPSA